MEFWKAIILPMIQFYLTVQFIFIISCLTWNRQPECEKKDITYLIIKAIQYFIHIVFYPNLENYEIYLKYHSFLYFIMDIYGLILIDTQTVTFWIILAQLIIGLIVISLIIIYNSLYMILSYILNLFTCKENVKLHSIFQNYLIAQFFIAALSFNLFRFYDHSFQDINYLFCRLTQYFITYYKPKIEFSIKFYYVIDMIMNFYGLLYLNSGTVLFWIIFIQIILGSFHYCLILLTLVIYTISKYYQCVCSYVCFRLNQLSSNNDENSLQGLFLKNFIKLYLITQIIFAIISTIQSSFIEPIYIILRIIQYLFHLFYYLRNQGFTVYFNYHFTFYLIMDIYGLCLLSFCTKIYEIIILEIFLGFIIYYWLLIEYLDSINLNHYFSYEIMDAPFLNLIVSYLLLEIGLSILYLEFHKDPITYYLIIKIFQYGINLLYCIFKGQLQFENFFVLFLFFSCFQFPWGCFLMINQNYAFGTIFSQIVVDFIIIGGIFHYIISNCSSSNKNFLQLWINQQENLNQLYKYEMTNLLWCFGQNEIQNYIQNQENTCAICQETLDNGSQKTQLQCHKSHEFHNDCLQRWEEYKSTCPVCRNKIQK